MKIISKLAVVAFMFVVSAGYSQNTDQTKKTGPDDTYSRSSISYLLLDFGGEKYSSLLNQAINSANMPSKFDHNNIKRKVITSPYVHVEGFPNTKNNINQVLNSLRDEKYAMDVVKFWWKIKDDGSYSTKLIQERGEYNASDMDYNQAMASKVGRAKIGDQGLKLIGNSYVLVLDFQNIKTMDEIYDEKDREAREKAEKNKTEFTPVKRTKNGFKGDLTTYLFRVNYPDTVQGYFDASFIDEKSIDNGKLEKIFDNVYSPFTFIKITNSSAEGTQSNPGEFMAPAVQKSQDELMVDLVNNGITNSLNVIEKNIESFRVKTPVTNVSPIRAKIGKKEGLTHERRYFVWEYVSDASSKVVARKKAVIRASKVIDNRQDELGSTRESSFYQIGGGKIREGMTLQEAKDLGIGLGMGYGSDGFVARLDINIGQWIDVPMKQWKLYADIGSRKSELDPDNYDIGSSTFPAGKDDFKSFKWSVGLVKEFPFMHNMHFAGYLGWGTENLTWDDGSDLSEKLLASGIQLGARMGINLGSPSVQLIGSLNYHAYGSVTYKYTPDGGDEESTDLGDKWADIFPDKKAASFNLSLRFNF